MSKRDDEQFDWDADDQMGLWEHQGHPLTLQDLTLAGAPPALPIEVAVYDGVDSSPFLVPLHVEYRGPKDAPAAIVITVQYPLG